MGGFSALLNIFNRLIPRPFPTMFHIDSSNQRKISQMEIFLRTVILGNFLKVYYSKFITASDVLPDN